MQIPKKVNDIIDVSEIDINNLTKSDINYRLRDIFSATYLDVCSWNRILLRQAIGNKKLPLHMDWYPSIEDDLFYFKLYKEGLVDIEFYEAVYDTENIEWQKFDSFMSDYLLDFDDNKNVYTNFWWNWSTRYDLKKILDENYEEFIDHMFNNILPWDLEATEDNIDYILWERFVMEVIISDWRKFINWLSNLLPNNDDIDDIIEKVINDYNTNSDNNFNTDEMTLYFPVMYFLKNWKLLDIFNFLERKWQLSILSIDNVFSKENFDNRISDLYLLEIKYKPNVFNLKRWIFNLYLKEYNNLWNDEVIDFITTEKWCNLMNWKWSISFIKTEKPYKIVKRYFKDKKTKDMNLSSLFKLLYWETYQKKLHEEYIPDIENIIKWINRKVKDLNNWKQYFSFKGQVLSKI